MQPPDPTTNPVPSTTEPQEPAPPTYGLARWLGLALLMIPVNVLACTIAMGDSRYGAELGFVLIIVGGLALLQIGFAIAAFVAAIKSRRNSGKAVHVWAAIIAFVVAGLGVFQGLMGALFVALSGAAWGRPLRIRGRLRHPELKGGSDWSRGETPNVNELDVATRRALEALWLHDAQKEHASVPAFTRISWMLCAVGAPPELLEGAHRAALEEADHACRCFALAAGYGGRAHSVEPMPDLLLAGFELQGPPLQVLALESLQDGCLLEDFNADVAGACAEVCRDPATRGVLQRIAREERSHAEFSWQVLQWSLQRGGEPVARAVDHAIAGLQRMRRPTSTSRVTAPLVAEANAVQLRAHGRIADEQWALIWPQRVEASILRARTLLTRTLLARRQPGSANELRSKPDPVAVA